MVQKWLNGLALTVNVRLHFYRVCVGRVTGARASCFGMLFVGNASQDILGDIECEIVHSGSGCQLIAAHRVCEGGQIEEGRFRQG